MRNLEFILRWGDYNMNVEECALKFMEKFPEYNKAYHEHMNDYGKVLGHIFFGDAINETLTVLLKKNEDINAIQRYSNFINYMYKIGDDAVKNIVIVTILEYLGDDKQVLSNAYNLLNDDIIKESIENEKSLGRYKL
jgi:hypothetical protein